MVRLQLLGDVRVEHDGADVDLSSLSRKGRMLLAMLALDRRAHGRSELAGRLWPDVREDSARASLRTALAQVRAELGAAAASVLRDERGGALGLEHDVRTDVEEVDRLVAAGDAEAALDRCGAEFLAGLDDDWVLERRDELRGRVMRGLGADAEAAESAGEMDAALRLTRRLVALDALAETPQRALMRRLAAAGDRAAALTVYDHFRERLASELHIAPSAATRELVEEIRAERSADTLVAAAPAVMPAGPRSPFVGRAGELRALTDEWARVREGERRVVVLAGEPGIGKTRLVSELSAAVHADEGLLLLGRCHEDGLIPYEPFADALRRYVGTCPAQTLSDQVGPHGPVLAALVPELSERIAAGAAPAAEPAASRLVQAIVAVVCEAARARPAVLVLEDVHWAEAATAVALRHLARATEDVSLLVLVTLRRSEVTPDHPIAGAIAEMRRARILAQHVLGGLDADSVGAIVAAETGGRATQDVVAAVHDRTEGNPYFVEELVREAGDLSSPAALALPQSVKDVLGRRVRGLPPDAIRLLETAAVIGSEFDVEVLGRATDATHAEVVDGLDAASAASVVVSGTTPGTCGFAHALVRETVYEGLSGVRRAHLHGRVGEVLAGMAGADAGTLARHFAAAGDHGRALRHHVTAARTASGLDAVGTGIAHCDAALASAALAGPSSEVEALTAAAAYERGRLLHHGGRQPEGAASLETALVGARAAGDRRLERQTLVELGQAYRSSDAPRAHEVLTTALALAEQEGDVGGQIRALSRNALLCVDGLRLDRAVDDAERGLVLARELGDPRFVAEALDAVKLVCWQLGDMARLAEMAAELEAIQRHDGEPWKLCFTMLEAAQVPMAALRWEEGAGRLTEVLALAERVGSSSAVALVLDSLAAVHEAGGDTEAALAACARGVQLVEGGGYITFVGWVQATAGLVLLRLRAPDRAAELLEHGLAMAQRAGSRHEVLRCSALLARAISMAGDGPRARALAAQAEDLWASIAAPPGRSLLYVAPALAALADVLADAGAPDRGERLLAPALAAASGPERAWFAIPLRISAARCLAARGAAEAADAVLAPALDAWHAGAFAPAWEALVVEAGLHPAAAPQARAAAATLADGLADTTLRAGLLASVERELATPSRAPS